MGPQPHLEVFDIAAKSRVEMKAASFQDQTLSVETERGSSHAREHEKMEPLWAGPGSAKFISADQPRYAPRGCVCGGYGDRGGEAADSGADECICGIEAAAGDQQRRKRVDSLVGARWVGTLLSVFGADGKLKNQITHGEFVAEDIAGVDEKARALFLTAEGREDGEDPYYTHVYRANLDGSGMKLLDAGNESHAVNMSDSGKFSSTTVRAWIVRQGRCCMTTRV